MHSHDFEQMFKLNKSFGMPFLEWNRTTLEIMKHLSEKNLKLLGDYFELLSDQCKRLSACKSEEFFEVQKDIMNENMTAQMENIQKCIQNNMESWEEIAKVWGSVAARVTEKAVEKAQNYTDKEKMR
jgi:hypothetical protein